MRRRISITDCSDLDIWADPSMHPDWKDWQEWVTRDQIRFSPALYMRRNLLDDVVFAGGGVEAEYRRLRAALDEAQEYVTHGPGRFQHEVQSLTPHRRIRLNAPSLVDANYAFANLLTWTCAVEDRIERKWKGRPLGLAPALKDGTALRRDVEEALEVFRARVSPPSLRWLRNFAVHAGYLPGGGTPYAFCDDEGRLRVPVPDAPEKPVLTWEQFRFEDDRDMLTYAKHLMDAVDELVGAVLSAFEENLPQRRPLGDG